MGMNKIAGEKQCSFCECMFVDKDDPTATRCKECRKYPEDQPAVEDHGKYLHQDVDVVELKAQVDSILKTLSKMQKDMDKKGEKPEYSHKCEACGQVFVSNAAASRYCPDCGKAK